ncbi:stromal membrane-associated protein 1 isoform X3 [Girardinichthys multiradiatus]|uniref:stromal membrane-associated protein 1 isoform X3 n=1 Tax=Girardinichthys multiradiatus TaxID=208333 RepID=UPI001FAE6583|nr:stromal membrane-associated protein 1 isoform X3 [Girardinichthys multiradiatus]
MTTRSEREKAQKLNEQHQAILTKLLREEDNKYCADCEAKGPRWASWNLGVFMCIRCAGIHRNLGVHISRVKSVNLDQWTPEQIQSMVDMGNTRARQLYEAHLPENFRRPQTDQAVEVFIRDKYERKKYYDQEALAAASQKLEAAAPSTSPSSQADKTKSEKERDKKKEEKKKEKVADKVERHSNTKLTDSRVSPNKSTEPTVDLLGLGAPDLEGEGSDQMAPVSNELDLFGPMVSHPLPPSNTKHDQSGSSATPSQGQPPTSSSSTTTTTKVEEKKLLSKDSILSLYGSSSVGSQPQSQHQPAAGPGAYMGQPQMPFNVPPTTAMGGGPVMSGMTLPNGVYLGMQQPGGMPHNQGQNVYSMPQGQQQQGQWNMSQMTQQMSNMALSGGEPVTGAPTTGLSTSPAPASGQTLSTQLWK